MRGEGGWERRAAQGKYILAEDFQKSQDSPFITNPFFPKEA